MLSCSWASAAFEVNNSKSEWERPCAGASGTPSLLLLVTVIGWRQNWLYFPEKNSGFQELLVMRQWCGRRPSDSISKNNQGSVLIPQDAAASWRMLHLQHLWSQGTCSRKTSGSLQDEKRVSVQVPRPSLSTPHSSLVKTAYSSMTCSWQRFILPSSAPVFLSTVFLILRLSSIANYPMSLWQVSPIPVHCFITPGHMYHTASWCHFLSIQFGSINGFWPLLCADPGIHNRGEI